MTAAPEAWSQLDEYLTSTRYAVRDPRTGRPLEKNYSEILEKRLLPKLRTLKSPLAAQGRLDRLAEAIEQELAKVRDLVGAKQILYAPVHSHLPLHQIRGYRRGSGTGGRRRHGG